MEIDIARIFDLSIALGVGYVLWRYVLADLKATKADLKATQAEVKLLQEQAKEDNKVLFTLITEVKSVVAAFTDETKDLKKAINKIIISQNHFSHEKDRNQNH